MMTRNSKRKLQEEAQKTSSKSVRVDSEISTQLAKIDEHIETESQEFKKGKKTCIFLRNVLINSKKIFYICSRQKIRYYGERRQRKV